ncbi:protein-disulfide reductase DsbD family protein [Zavarzinella formosa]|uniref:protein-disulfide reductase DsbD family protein n=1 Tax=Zavarzinella formosa TaxID=360055 RepID=UPI0002EC2010|nr:cytochrome c biogenesis protein CcdA [Zavarzinella formosa]
MNRMLLALVGLAASLFSGSAQAQGISFAKAVKSIDGRIEPAEAKPGQTVQYILSVKLNPGYYTYPSMQPDQKEKDSQTTIQLPEPGDLLFVEPVHDPAGAKTKPGPAGTLSYYPEGATWSFTAVVSPNAAPGTREQRLKLFRIPICNSDTDQCLPPKVVPVVASFKVADGPAVEVDPKYREAVVKVVAPARNANPSPVIAPEPKKEPAKVEQNEEPKAVSLKVPVSRNYSEDMKEVLAQLPAPTFDNAGFIVFLLTAAGWGFVTLLTPCVFPMVPITVSVFIKQSERQGTNPLAQALIYAGTIVVVLGLAAMTLLSFFSRLAVDPYMNVALGTLFVVLSLSLFGLFDLTLPSWIVNLTANREGKGGYLGTVFMALSFTLVSFTCVAPFLGGFSGMVASGNFGTFQLMCGGLAFAAAFASPFFVLALFPSLLKKLPKSGGWMNTIKVVMGFLELAAALKFYRTAELRLTDVPSLFTYDLVLSLWVVLMIVTGLYLLGLFKLPHDHDAGEHHIGPFRLLTAIGVMALGIYLLPGLFSKGNEKNRPGGTVFAWVDAFLLPEPSIGSLTDSGDGKQLAWSGDLRRSLDDARSKGGFVFIDFTGKTCANCRLNEENIFSQQEFKDLLKKFTLVQIYTDTVPSRFYDGPVDLARQNADGSANNKFQMAAFGGEQLPLYVILKPEQGGKTSVFGVYDEGKISKVDAFRNFLKKPFAEK